MRLPLSTRRLLSDTRARGQDERHGEALAEACAWFDAHPPGGARPPDPKPEPCNYCRALLLWPVTGRGVAIPVDAEPSPNGNVLILAGSAGVLGPRKAAAARATGQQLHLHHRLSCPFVNRWTTTSGKGHTR